MNQLTMTNTQDTTQPQGPSDSLRIVGSLKVYKQNSAFPDSDRTLVVEEENLIMIGFKRAIVNNMFNQDAVLDLITTLKVGTGGCTDTAGLYPKSPANTMTNLYAPLVTTPVAYTYNNSVPSITFTAGLDQDTAVGQRISEAGLFTAGGAMVNIKTFPAILKEFGVAMYFEWTIKVL